MVFVLYCEVLRNGGKPEGLLAPQDSNKERRWRGVSRLGAPFNFKRPWSTSYDAALPMLISRSVTGWPHHLTCRAPACAGRSPKPPRSGAAPGRHATGMWLDKEGTCFASRLMRERYPPSPPFHRELPRLSGEMSIDRGRLFLA